MSSVIFLLPDGVFSKPRERTEEERSSLEAWEVNSNLATSIGMTALATADRKRLLDPIRVRDLAAHDVVPLTQAEWDMWCAWLHRSYRTDIDKNSMRRGLYPWSVYTFDAIPTHVRNFILNVQQKELFDALEIRTPEDAAEDPVLFGWIGDEGYLLARWGESDDALLTADQIRDGVAARREAQQCADRREEVFFVGSALSGVVGVLAFIAGAMTVCACNEGHEYFIPIAAGGALLVAGLLGGTCLWVNRLQLRRSAIVARAPYAF